MKIRAPIYKRLEYAVFTGTLHVDTGVSGNNENLEVVCTYVPNTTNQQCIFAARTNSGGGLSFWTDGYCHFGNSSSQVAGVSSSGKHTVRLSKAGLYFDDKKLTFTPGTSFQDSTLVFGRIPDDNRAFTGKIYRFTVYDSSTIVRDLVSAKRISDNAIGYYDFVNKMFYTASGTGNLSAGTETTEYLKTECFNIKSAIGQDNKQAQAFIVRSFFLPQGYQQLNYVKRTAGEVYVDTGYSPNYLNGFDIEIKFRPLTSNQRYCLVSNRYGVGTSSLPEPSNPFLLEGDDSNHVFYSSRLDGKPLLSSINCHGDKEVKTDSINTAKVCISEYTGVFRTNVRMFFNERSLDSVIASDFIGQGAINDPL